MYTKGDVSGFRKYATQVETFSFQPQFSSIAGKDYLLP